MRAFDSAFSPFARKVRLAIELKGLDAEFVDGLDRRNHDALRAVNSRLEVPALVDGDLVIVGSSDIVDYLDHRYPETPLLPADPAKRAAARHWQRIADTLVDAALTNVSYWSWAERDDTMPEGLLDAGRRSLGSVYDAMERDLEEGPYLCGDLSIADVALFPHISGAGALGLPYDFERHGRVAAWLKQLRKNPVFLADLKRVRSFLQNVDGAQVERRKLFWRGDRIEWMLANGQHDWFFGEIREDRVLWPPQTLA